MAEVVLALFNTVREAHDAVNDLANQGFKRGDIGLAVNDPRKRYVGEGRYEDYEDEDVDAGEGAGFGAVVGGITGLLAGLVAITIPGVGPVIAAGPLAAALGAGTGAVIGAAAGAITGGITASLVDMGVPEEEATYYTEAVRRGNALVTVTADGDDLVRAMNILRKHYPIDVEERAAQWREHGWEGYDPKADPFTSEELAEERERYVETTNSDPAVRRYDNPRW
ncbi:MAG: hypothetical protein K8L99_26045 [Anaerolineae bacterium]|nr:hypothetical protein [Anaerolineae bacterium]